MANARGSEAPAPYVEPPYCSDEALDRLCRHIEALPEWAPYSKCAALMLRAMRRMRDDLREDHPDLAAMRDANRLALEQHAAVEGEHQPYDSAEMHAVADLVARAEVGLSPEMIGALRHLLAARVHVNGAIMAIQRGKREAAELGLNMAAATSSATAEEVWGIALDALPARRLRLVRNRES